MAIYTFFRVQCVCERYLAPEASPEATVTDSTDSPLFVDFSSAYDGAVRRGWSSYPLTCPDCAAQRAKRQAMNNKIAGLYLNLAKAMNALEEAGEDPQPGTAFVDGEHGGIFWNPDAERWTVSQA